MLKYRKNKKKKVKTFRFISAKIGFKNMKKNIN